LLCDVGIGISQVIPVVASVLLAEGVVMLEQPELHVHPVVQVELGDLFIRSLERRKQIIVETHSEHIVLRLLRRIRETHDNELPKGSPRLTPELLSVLYVETNKEGVSVRRLRVDANGEFEDRWPHGFFAERVAELF
jgi:predicted ATPase